MAEPELPQCAFSFESALTIDCSSDALSDLSSPLTSPLSRSPSPPSHYLPSPPRSGPSSQASPRPESDESLAASAEHENRPPKRRKLRDMPRETKHLDLRSLSEDNTEAQQVQLERLLKVLHKKRKIVVIAGAGISTSAGVPDFRSSNGLFKSLKGQHKLKSSGKQLFDAAVYKDDKSTSSFHDMVRSLSHLTKSAKPTPFHHLLATLAHQGRLLRLYSQNVDGIDTSIPPLATEVPLSRRGPWPKTIQLHGGLEKMICTKCHTLSDFRPELFEGPVPPACGECQARDHIRTELESKRSHGIGRLRPRMVLYNEHNPDDEAIGAVTRADLKTRPDAIIVVGTTLKVPGVKRIVREMCKVVQDRRDGLTVWINNDAEPILFDNCWDLVVRGTCDEVAELAALRKWDDEDIGDFEEILEVKERMQEVKVVVNSPLKIQQKYHMEGLPTPLDSPHMSPAPKMLRLLQTCEEGALTPCKIKLRESSLDFSRLLQLGKFDVSKVPGQKKAPATKPVTVTKPAAAAKKVGPKKTVSATKLASTVNSGAAKKAPAARKPASSANNSKINTTFKATKPMASKLVIVGKGKGSRAPTPSTPSKQRTTGMNRTPSKASPMRPVSAVDERVNKSPVRFPNLFKGQQKLEPDRKKGSFQL